MKKKKNNKQDYKSVYGLQYEERCDFIKSVEFK